NWPTVEAVAVNGDGVFQTLKAISQGVIKRLNREQAYSDDSLKRVARASALAGKKPAGAGVSGPAKAVAFAPTLPPPKSAVPAPARTFAPAAKTILAPT